MGGKKWYDFKSVFFFVVVAILFRFIVAQLHMWAINPFMKLTDVHRQVHLLGEVPLGQFMITTDN